MFCDLDVIFPKKTKSFTCTPTPIDPYTRDARVATRMEVAVGGGIMVPEISGSDHGVLAFPGVGGTL